MVGPIGSGGMGTQTGLLAGTPEYLAPELAEGAHRLSPAADVFSLGILAHELLAGSRPFTEPPVVTVFRLADLVTAPSPSLSGVEALPAEAAGILDRCLAFDPAERPTARAVAETLESLTWAEGAR